jgi:hypothetical protein
MSLELVVSQLKQHRGELEKQLRGLSAAITVLDEKRAQPTNGRRPLSAAARQKISAAQRARWAKVRRQKKAA